MAIRKLRPPLRGPLIRSARSSALHISFRFRARDEKRATADSLYSTTSCHFPDPTETTIPVEHFIGELLHAVSWAQRIG